MLSTLGFKPYQSPPSVHLSSYEFGHLDSNHLLKPSLFFVKDQLRNVTFYFYVENIHEDFHVDNPRGDPCEYPHGLTWIPHGLKWISAWMIPSDIHDENPCGLFKIHVNSGKSTRFEKFSQISINSHGSQKATWIPKNPHGFQKHTCIFNI